MSTTPALRLVQQRLEERARQLRDEIAAAGTRRGEIDVHQVIDRKEEASDQVRETIDSAGIERDLAELRDIERARQRIADGSYGRCVDCDEPIEPARLLAQPTALRCTECQSAAERRRAGSAHPPRH